MERNMCMCGSENGMLHSFTHSLFFVLWLFLLVEMWFAMGSKRKNHEVDADDAYDVVARKYEWVG